MRRLKIPGRFALLMVAIVGVLVLLLFPYHVAHHIERAKQALSDIFVPPLPAEGPPAPTLPADGPHLWQFVWNGEVLAKPHYEPSAYDYQYDELQQFFVQRATLANQERRNTLNFDGRSSDTLLALRDAIQRQLTDLSGMQRRRNSIQDRSETLVGEEKTYALWRVKFINAEGLSIEGLLARPTTCQAPCPVLIAANGWSSSPEAIMGLDQEDYQHQFGRVFADSGYVVFAVHIPATPSNGQKTNAAERHGWLLANMSGTQYWSYWWLDKVMSAIDYIETLDYVDMHRVALYGISMGGEAALYSTVVDARIAALIVSGTNVLTPRLHMLLQQRRFIYPQMYMWNAAALPDPDELLFAVYPRPVCVELGRHDTTGNIGMALHAAQRVGNVYRQEGKTERFLLAVHDKKTTADGHETEIGQCKSFLDTIFGVHGTQSAP